MTERRQQSASTPAPPVGEERMAWELAASVANDGLWILDSVRSEIRLSTRTRVLLGYAPEEEPPTLATLAQHVDAKHIGALRAALGELTSGQKTRMEMELRVLTRGGETRWMLLRAKAKRGASGAPLLIAGALGDIDRRKRAELALREELRRDHLTGLPNRASIGEWLTARLARCAMTPGSQFAILYIDLDRFKIINDSLGHATGDALLLETASRLEETLGSRDLVARVGGDEFVMLVDTVSGADHARILAALVQQRMRDSIDANGREVYTSLSIGIRVSGSWSSRPSDMLRDADVAMYRAKQDGGARSTIFDQAMFEEMSTKFRVQAELHRALNREEFVLAYQPIFDGRDARLCGFEALARWNHPTRGRLSASEFVAEANESGLIVQIGRWVLSEACRQLADWTREYPDSVPLSVAVNLCDRELLDPDFASSVEGALRESGLDPARLVLEMTEGVMMSHTEAAVPALRRLRRLGVQIQLDDFGKGYSSLSALRRLPLTAIKIDRSFIAGVVRDEECRAMVATIAAFARALSLDVVAEGVETQEHADVLASMGGFRFVQGHYFGRPVGVGEAERNVRDSTLEVGGEV